MSLAEDLLQLAKMSSRRRKKSLSDAEIRRTISTAYYALFHLLIAAGTAQLVSHPKLRQLLGRAYRHDEMTKAARWLRGGQGGLPSEISAVYQPAGIVVTQEVRSVAAAFIELQEARHDADYDQMRHFNRNDMLQMVAMADEAFTHWHYAENDPAAIESRELLLAVLMIGSRWKRS